MQARKNTAHDAAATDCAQVTMTSGGMSRARPLTTANCVAWVRAAPRESANQLTRPAAATPGSGEADGSHGDQWLAGIVGWPAAASAIA